MTLIQMINHHHKTGLHKSITPVITQGRSVSSSQTCDKGQGDHEGPEEVNAHRKEEVLNGFEIFLVCVSVISVSVQS